MPPKYDYYKELGVKPTTKSDQIKAVYKELVKKWHPDLNPDNRDYAEEKMRRLTQAFNTLSNREKRKEYDEGPPFVYKLPKFMKPGKPGVNPKYLREPGEPKKTFWDKMKDMMFVKDPKEEEQKRIAHQKMMTQQGVNSFIMGISCLEKKQENMLELARAEFKSVLRESSEQPEALFNLALVEYKLGEYEEARKLLEKARFHLPNDRDVGVFLGMIQDEE